MGILGLMKFIADNAPDAIKINSNNLFGRKIAIDASMALYQALIAIRTNDMNSFSLTNDVGETTSHISGIFFKTTKMIHKGIKPIYVFDGKPPIFKTGELAKRSKRKKEALEALSEAKDTGDHEALVKAKKRSVSISKEQIEEAKKILRLMGIPVIESPCEADAQCVAFVKEGLCYAVGTEDMDTLTLGTNILIRHLGVAEARKKPILEISLEKVLEGLELDMNQFIDLCILFGCDYCEKIHGIGPKTAYQLIKKHKSIEEILKHIDTEKYKVPEEYHYKEAREMFLNPEITDCSQFDLQIKEPDYEGIIQFMVNEKGFNADRIQNAIDKLKKSYNSKVQGRITSFFTMTPQTKPDAKRKTDDMKKKVLPPTKKRKTSKK